jgi:hypothetical protein
MSVQFIASEFPVKTTTAGAQVGAVPVQPIGGEFLVNTTTADAQIHPTITLLLGGDFVVAWTDGAPDLSSPGRAIRAQRFNDNGSTAGPEFVVNTTTLGTRGLATSTGLLGGGFVVAWTDYSATNAAVLAQMFDAGGSKIGGEILVNTTPVANAPSVAPRGNGGFVVTWEEQGGVDIRAQMFNADGSKSGSEFVVNTTSTGRVDGPKITVLSGGRFVVTWAGHDVLGTFGIFAQIFNANGAKLGAEFQVNTKTLNNQFLPAVTTLANGGFVVAWRDQESGNLSEGDVRAQIFDANGSSSGPEFLVNTATAGTQSQPAVAPSWDGRFVVAWADTGQAGIDTSMSAIRAQVFNPNGAKLGSDFQVNTTTPDFQFAPAMTLLRPTSTLNNRIVVVWTDNSQTGGDTSGAAVRGQIIELIP